MTTTTKNGRDSVPTSIRITPICMTLWSELAKKQGLTRTGYLETTIRRLAQEAGIRAEETTPETAQQFQKSEPSHEVG